MTNNKFSNSELFDLYRSKKLIPFIGAGFSKRFGLPTWSELIDLLAKELGWDPRVFKLNGDFLQLCEYFVEVRCKGKVGPLRSLLDKKFSMSNEKIKASKSHMLLPKLDFSIIYTTNFDNLIEKAYALSKKPCHVITNSSDIADSEHSCPQIVKFHGTFENDESLVLTQSHYFKRLDFEHALDIKLRADILGKSLLFIGYSLQDINVRYLLYKLDQLQQKEGVVNKTPTAFLVTFAAGEVQRQLLKQWKVKIIELDPKDKTKSLDLFLKGFKNV